MKLLLVRHGQPEWVRDGRGVIDPPLTELGRAQARRLADGWPEGRAPTRLWVSPACRSRQTAEPLAERFGLEPEVHDDLVELKLPPRFAGAAAHEVGKIIHAAKHESPETWWGGPAGREPFDVFHDRITRAIEGALETVGLRRGGGAIAPKGAEPRVDPRWHPDWEHSEERVVLVAHAGTNAVVATHLLGFPPTPWAWETFLCAHAGITRLHARKLMGARVFGLQAHNDLAHLGEDERSH